MSKEILEMRIQQSITIIQKLGRKVKRKNSEKKRLDFVFKILYNNVPIDLD